MLCRHDFWILENNGTSMKYYLQYNILLRTHTQPTTNNPQPQQPFKCWKLTGNKRWCPLSSTGRPAAPTNHGATASYCSLQGFRSRTAQLLVVVFGAICHHIKIWEKCGTLALGGRWSIETTDNQSIVTFLVEGVLEKRHTGQGACGGALSHRLG